MVAASEPHLAPPLPPPRRAFGLGALRQRHKAAALPKPPSPSPFADGFDPPSPRLPHAVATPPNRLKALVHKSADQLGRLRHLSLSNPTHVDRLVDVVSVGLFIAAFPMCFLVPPVGFVLAIISATLHLGTHAKDLLAPDPEGTWEGTLFRRALVLGSISAVAYASIALLAGGLANPVGIAIFVVGHVLAGVAFGALVWRNRHAGSLPKIVKGTCKDVVTLAFH